MTKGLAAGGCPGERVVLLGEFGEGLGDGSIIEDEGALVAQDSKGTTNLFNCGEVPQPVSEAICFGRVYREFVAINNYAEIFYAGLFKYAFGRSEEV